MAGPPVVGKWGLPQGKGGRLLVGPDLRVEGQERIFATGDIALTGDDPLPQLAQPAIQMGRHAADQIRRLEAGQATVPFQYHDKGTMATIGSRSAVVQLNHGIRFRGTIAWLAWLALHLVTLLGGRNRISALINLSYRYLSWRRGGGIIVGDDPPARTPKATDGIRAGGRRSGRASGLAAPDARERRSGGDHAGDPEHVNVVPGQLLEQVRQRVQAGIGREHHRDRVAHAGPARAPRARAPLPDPDQRGSPGCRPGAGQPPAPGRPRAGHHGGPAQLAGRAGGEQVPGAWSGADQGEPSARPDPGYRHAHVA